MKSHGWVTYGLSFYLGLFVFTTGLHANPTGGTVAAGSAAIAGQGTSTVTVNQASNVAIINWQTFSINSGELTQFIQPSVQSAALNRVLGGQTSIINGTLSANGQIYLVNGNGIVVGPGGVISANAFTASTRDISDADFLAGNRHFTGSSNAGMQNFGKITALGGDVVLIGKTVDNEGTINATNGTAGLIAADDVLLAQKNADGSTITVSPSAMATSASSQVGVHNSGSIIASAEELKAANGNIYALAVQNEGTIRASTVLKQGGHIWLTSDSGTVSNSGTLNASATAVGGKGGSVVVKSTSGKTINTASGQILAAGGKGGTGGTIETSGGTLQIGGLVNAGPGGDWLLDPVDVTIDNGSGVAPDVNVTTLEMALNAGTNETVQAAGTSDSGNIDLNTALTWTSSAKLQLTATGNINLYDPLSGASGTLSLSAGGTISDTASLSVKNFILQAGTWQQIVGQNGLTALPTFSSPNNFALQSGATFERFAGGDGSMGSPYQLTDVYGLQGLTSNSALWADNYELDNDIDASSTVNWNSGAGFVPIANGDTYGTWYSGIFNGQNYTINGLTIDTPEAYNVGLFGQVAGTVENLKLTNVNVTGNSLVGGLVGLLSAGTINNCSAGGTVSEGGTSPGYIGGLVGTDYDYNGTIEYSSSSVNVSAPNSHYVGGLIGMFSGTMTDSYATGNVLGYYEVGGLAGENGAYYSGSITDCYATGNVSGSSGSDQQIGGLVGVNAPYHAGATATITDSYATGNVSGEDAIGGLVGWNGESATATGSISNSYSTGNVSAIDDGGGVVGFNYIGGSVLDTYAKGTVTASLSYAGGVIGYNNTSASVTDSFWDTDTTTTGVGDNAGGTVTRVTGDNTATLEKQAIFTTNLVTAGGTAWDFTNTWTTNGDTTTPLLKPLSVNFSGSTPGVADSIDLISNGAVLYTTTASGSAYGFYVPDNVLTAGALVTDVTGHTTDTYYITSTIPTASVTGVNLTSSTLSVLGTGQASNTGLGAAAGLLNTTTYDINYTVSSSNLSTKTGVAMSIAAPYLLDGNITASGALSTTVTGALSGSKNVTLTAASMSFVGSLDDFDTVTLNSTGAISDTGSVIVGGFILENGSWSQIASTLPTFTDSGDFELQNSSTFLRAAGGAGTSGNPYKIADIYGLQGIGSPSNSLLGTSGIPLYYTQTQNIDASNTVNWNSGAGFVPIGNSTTAYNGTFNGQGNTISSLTISRSAQSQIGLFGETHSGSTIENVGLLGGSISGSTSVGGLVGVSNGTVEKSYDTGIVTGTTNVGGLIGSNGGTVELSYASGAVNGTTSVGGLVGDNMSGSTVETSYATGTVAGTTDVGGLVGSNDGGTVEASFSIGAVTGTTAVGGLVGNNNSGTVETGYWLQDAGINVGLSGIGSSSSNTGATPETLANLKLLATYTPAGTTPPDWDFTLGTGVWGINAYTSSGVVNNGLPYFQWQYPTIALITAANQTTTYNATAIGTGFSTTDYTVTYAPGYSSLSSYVSSGPSLSVSGSNINVGTTNQIVISVTPDSSYAVEVGAPATESFSARAISVSSSTGQTKVYGTNDPTSIETAYTLTSGTLVGGNTLTGDMGRSVGETAGSYAFIQNTVTVSDGNSGNNYAITFDGTTHPFQITKAGLTSSLANLSKTYGTNDPTVGNIAVTLGGLIDTTVSDINDNNTVIDDTNAVSETVASLHRQTGENVGTYNVTSETFNALTGTAAGNYSTPTFSGTPTLTINKANLTASIANQNKIYGFNDPALILVGVSLNGVVDNSSISTWNGTVAINDTLRVFDTLSSLTRDSGENVGTYNITNATFNTLIGLSKGNYNAPTALTGTPTLTINQENLLASVTNQTKVYGTNDPLLSGIEVNLTGVIDRSVSTWDGSVSINDTNNVSASLASLTRQAGENVGNYIITGANFEPLGGSAAGNYAAPIFLGISRLSITKASLTASITNPSIVYGSNDPSISGITVNLGGVVDNSSISTWNGTVSVNDTGFISDTLATLSRQGGEDVGNYTITSETFNALTGSAKNNYYAPTSLTGTPMLSITPADLTASIEDPTKVYGTDDPSVTGITMTLGGIIDNSSISTWNGPASINDTDDVTDSLVSLMRQGGEDVGNHDITGETFAALSGSAKDNYNLPTTLTGNPYLAITAADLTASIGDQTKVYGENDPSASSITVNLGGIIDNSSISTWNGTVLIDDTNNVAVTLASVTRDSGENVGHYNYTVAIFNSLTGDSADNYNVPTFTTGSTLNITPATLTYVANPVSINLGQSIPPLGGTVTGFINGTVDGVVIDDNLANATNGRLVFATTANNASPAGLYPVNGSGLTADNYSFIQAPGNATALTIGGFQFGQPGNPFFNFVAQFNSNANYNTFFTQSWFPLFDGALDGWLIPVFSPDDEPHPVYTAFVPGYGPGGKWHGGVIAFGSSFTVNGGGGN